VIIAPIPPLSTIDLAYLHRSPHQDGIAVKAGFSEILVAANGGRAQIVRTRKRYCTVALPSHALILLLRSCNLAFVNATESLRRAR